MRACENCGKDFEAATARVTCSRSCAVALSWKNPATKNQRSKSIAVTKNTPEAMARLAAHNERRWSDPAQRTALSEQNRREWAKPRKAARRAAGIRKSHQRPEMRAFYSRMRTEQWATDINYRTKTVDGIRRSKGSPEYRALFSQLLAERWNDPVMRAKYTAGIRRFSQAPEYRARQSERMAERWRTDDNFRAIVAASMEFYWSKPESREHHRQIMKNLWSDPVWRMRQLKLINDGGGFTAGKITQHLDSASDLMSEVDGVIPKGLPDFMRMDIASDLTLALLEGDIKLSELKANVKPYLTAHRRMFPDKWGPISIDAPLPGTEGFTIADTLSNDSPHF